MIRTVISALFGSFLLTAAAHAKGDAPLFADDEPLQIQIVAPFKDLVRTAPKSTDPYAGELRVIGAGPDAHLIELRARGNSRRARNTCQFPPLRVEFQTKPDAPNVFAGEKSLKLVTHCRTSKAFQQNVFTEYAVYKLLNALSPISLKVRLAEIEYLETGSEKLVAKRYGFFIEDIDDAAKRNDLKEAEIKEIAPQALNREAGARYGLFQYMIGNLDWSVQYGPEGENCCHNTKLLSEDEEVFLNLFPVPYDFDYSGLVDAPYALPPEGIPVRSVRNRYYRGFCLHNNNVRVLAADMLAKKATLLSVFDAIPAMTPSAREKAKDYLEGFFEDIGDPAKFEKNIIGKCRT